MQWIALGAMALGLFQVGCNTASGSSTPSNGRTSALPKGAVPADSDRFPHALHTGSGEQIRSYKGRGLRCNDCHPQEAVVAGEYSRPGKNEHAPCDECHADEFYKPPGKFCKNCHTTVDPKVQGATKMQAYPERGFRRVLASEFSHRLHLDRDSMEGAVGFHIGCDDCHSRDAKSKDPQMPGHKECAKCHSQKKQARNKLNMAQCKSCHPQRNIELVRGRIFIKGDIKFAHSDHVKDIGGKPVPCDHCHNDIPQSRTSADASIPVMQRCATCHENSKRTPDRVRISKCEVCHSQITDGAPPDNHIVGKELPENHTLEFRRNHGEQARNKNANCRFCHDGMTDSTRDNCYQCHAVMKPRDHNLGWREDSHGREAAADRDRCATCHTVDYCTACHSIPPRSHQPFAEFRLGGHAQAAKFDLRSCMACHTFETTCSACHRRLR